MWSVLDGSWEAQRSLGTGTEAGPGRITKTKSEPAAGGRRKVESSAFARRVEKETYKSQSPYKDFVNFHVMGLLQAVDGTWMHRDTYQAVLDAALRIWMASLRTERSATATTRSWKPRSMTGDGIGLYSLGLKVWAASTGS